MSGKIMIGSRTSGKSSPTGGIVSEDLIEDIAATSPILPEIKTYEITALAGAHVAMEMIGVFASKPEFN